MSVTILDPTGFPLTTSAALVATLAAVQRGECIQTGPATFQVFPHQDFRCVPQVSPTAKRRAVLAHENRKANR